MRASLQHTMRRVSLAAAMLSSFAVVASAQLPNASSAAYGMAGNFTAMARGFEAVSWNPANLGMPGSPGLSLGLAMAGGTIGLAPVDFTMLHEFSGKVIDSATKASWIDKARASGGQRGRIDGGVTPVALTVGPLGFQVGSSVYTSLNLSPDAVEAVLFGNAGNNGGQPKTLDFTGSHVRAGVFSTAAASFALPLPLRLTAGILPNEHAAIGITGKYVMGSGLWIADDIGSSLGPTDVQLRFGMIAPDTALDDYRKGFGAGTAADLSFAWSGGPWRVGALAENVYNTFKWDTTRLAYRPGTGSFGSNGASSTTFDQQPYASAPQSLRDIVANQTFKPALSIGAAMNLTGGLTITADMRTQTGGDDAIIIGPKTRMGVGAEWRVLPFLPLRGGVATVTDGWQAGAGVGLRLMGFELGVSTSIRRIGETSQSGVMVGLFGLGR
ncbi:MAG TPA: hypothetical protein VFT29_10415 [Gemmatimonadaceae bacterium]|nr:hypothetical protein [Gemmatimonadaceae bacterium]